MQRVSNMKPKDFRAPLAKSKFPSIQQAQKVSLPHQIDIKMATIPTPLEIYKYERMMMGSDISPGCNRSTPLMDYFWKLIPRDEVYIRNVADLKRALCMFHSRTHCDIRRLEDDLREDIEREGEIKISFSGDLWHSVSSPSCGTTHTKRGAHTEHVFQSLDEAIEAGCVGCKRLYEIVSSINSLDELLNGWVDWQFWAMAVFRDSELSMMLSEISETDHIQSDQ